MLTWRRRQGNLAKDAQSIHNARMSFHHITSKAIIHKPQRAPEKNATRVLQKAPAETPDDSHDFPSFYANPIQAGANDELNSRALDTHPPLAASTERLIELVGAEMGCPHEEIEILKKKATENPTIIEYCQEIFDQRIRPRREVANPFNQHDQNDHCLISLEGRFGEILLRMPMTDAIRPYHHQKLEIYAIEKTPWATKGLPTPK